MKSTLRPLSPHLQVYSLPLTGLISISHRVAGVFLALGLLLLVYILYGIADGADAFATMQERLNWPLFILLYWGFIYALFFHLVHGIRHLFWDVGLSFDMRTMKLLALLELLISLLLTVTVLFIF